VQQTTVHVLIAIGCQSWGLRPRSYDKTCLRPASVLVLVLYFWSCLKHCCARQALCGMIMLKCNKHLYFLCNKCRNSAKCNWSSYHFLTFFAQSYFLIYKHACCNRRVFSARQHICYSALYAIARPSVRLSVRPAVRHTGGSVKDG